MLTQEENEFLTRTGPGTPMGDLWRRFWLPAMLSSELPAPDCPPVRVRLLSEDLVAFRDTSGKVGLLAAHCAHRGASLFYGRNEEGGLRCVYHGWKYDVDGNCLEMLSEPTASSFKEKIHQRAYPCQERGGLIWTYMGPPHLSPELPEMEWMLVPDNHRYTAKIWVECNYAQAMEGDIDPSHVSVLHARLGGPVGAPFLERLAAGQGPIQNNVPGRGGLGRFTAIDTLLVTVTETDVGLIKGGARSADLDHCEWRATTWLAPGYTLVPSAPGLSQAAQVRVPMDDENSWFFRVRWYSDHPMPAQELAQYEAGGVPYPELIPGTFRPKANKDNDFLIDRDLQKAQVTGITSFPQQDRAMTDSMGPIIDRTQEHLGTNDAGVAALRRRLIRMASALSEGQEPEPAHHGSWYGVRAATVRLRRVRAGVPSDEGTAPVPAGQVG